MKLIQIFFLLPTLIILGQSADIYFPKSIGHQWQYETYDLNDSNGKVDSTVLIKNSLFLETLDFKGKQSNLIESMFVDTLENETVIVDSQYISFENSNVFEFLDFSSLLDTTAINDPAIIATLSNLTSWYNTHDFGAPLVEPKDFLRTDTTVNMDGQNVKIIIRAFTQRLGENRISVKAGEFDTQQFSIKINIDAEVTVIGTLSFDILDLNITRWIGPDNWIIKEYRPTAFTADLSVFGMPSMMVPGYVEELMEINTMLPPMFTSVPGDTVIMVDQSNINNISNFEYSYEGIDLGNNPLNYSLESITGFAKSYNMTDDGYLTIEPDLDDIVNGIYEILIITELKNRIFSVFDTSKVSYDYVVDVNDFSEKVDEFSLKQNYPNPFNPTTAIEYIIPNAVGTDNFRHVSLNVFDALGRKIASLVNEQQSPGTYKVQFNASHLSSGTYIYQLKTDNKIKTKKMILLK